jgi:hypothetical protein
LSNDDEHGIKQWLAEQNALASIDIVYFLLFPVALYLLSRYDEIGKDILTTSMTVVLGIPFGLSLVFGLYAKMTDSVSHRVIAWYIFAFMAGLGFASTSLGALARLLFPSISVDFISLPADVFGLSVFSVGTGLAGIFMRWMKRLLNNRLRSRTLEIEKGFRAMDKPFFRSVLVRLQYSNRSDALLIIVGLFVFYNIFLLLLLLRSIGVPIP